MLKYDPDPGFSPQFAMVPCGGVLQFTDMLDPLILSWSLDWQLREQQQNFRDYVIFHKTYRASLSRPPLIYTTLRTSEDAKAMAKASCQVHIDRDGGFQVTGSGLFIATDWFVTAANLFEIRDPGENVRPSDGYQFGEYKKVYVTMGPAHEALSRDEGNRLQVDRVIWPGKGEDILEDWRSSDVVFCHVKTFRSSFYCTPWAMAEQADMSQNIELCAYGYPLALTSQRALEWSFSVEAMRALLKISDTDLANFHLKSQSQVQHTYIKRPTQQATRKRARPAASLTRENYEQQQKEIAIKLHDTAFAGYGRLVTSSGVLHSHRGGAISESVVGARVSVCKGMSGGGVGIMCDGRLRAVGLVLGGLMDKSYNEVFIFGGSLPFLNAYTVLIGESELCFHEQLPTGKCVQFNTSFLQYAKEFLRKGEEDEVYPPDLQVVYESM